MLSFVLCRMKIRLHATWLREAGLLVSVCVHVWCNLHGAPWCPGFSIHNLYFPVVQLEKKLTYFLNFDLLIHNLHVFISK